MPRNCVQRARRRIAVKKSHAEDIRFMKIGGVLAALGIAGLIILAACDPRTPPTRTELEAEASKLFESKRVFKDPDSNLCLVVLQGDFGTRPFYETYLVRCKSEKHLLEPVSE